MKKIKLFKKSVTNSKNEIFNVTFHATEDCEIVATVENSAAQVTHQDVGLVDLSGRRTRLPAKIHMAMQTSQVSDKQKNMLNSFQRICVARLAWSIGCFAVL